MPDVVTGGRPAVGLRVPSHPVAQALLAAFGGGIAAPSANRFGKVSPTTAAHVRADLGDDVDLVIDGGPCTVGVESTIVDCTSDVPTVLRHGGVTAGELAAVLDGRLVDVPTGPSRAPGMLESHYAPRARVELVPDGTAARRRLEQLRGEGQAADVVDPGADVVALRPPPLRVVAGGRRASPRRRWSSYPLRQKASAWPSTSACGRRRHRDRRDRSRPAHALLRASIQRSRTSSITGGRWWRTPATTSITVVPPASGSSSRRHQHR